MAETFNEWWTAFELEHRDDKFMLRRDVAACAAWDAARAAVRREGWVSVDERLPEQGQCVIVAWSDGSIEVDRIYEPKGPTWRHATVEGGTVTHWMYFPKHPAPPQQPQQPGGPGE
jgi:hypothetical protein